jgi:cell cycle serine/threonine-protein kinase CDC5/MSD2
MSNPPCRRIRNNIYEFPSDRRIAHDTKEYIVYIPSPDRSKRSTLLEILAFSCIDLGIIPPFIPISAHDALPHFRYLTRPMSIVNSAKLKKAVWLEGDGMSQP